MRELASAALRAIAEPTREARLLSRLQVPGRIARTLRPRTVRDPLRLKSEKLHRLGDADLTRAVGGHIRSTSHLPSQR